MPLYADFRSDTKSEQEGVVLDYGDFRITVARAGGANKQYLKLLETKARPFQRAIQAGAFGNDRSVALLQEVYAEAVVRNWETRVGEEWKPGIEGPDGALLPVTLANLVLTFTNLPDLFSDLVEQAGKGTLYRASLREEAAKNS